MTRRKAFIHDEQHASRYHHRKHTYTHRSPRRLCGFRARGRDKPLEGEFWSCTLRVLVSERLQQVFVTERPHEPTQEKMKGKEDKDPEEEEAFILFDCEELLGAFFGFGGGLGFKTDPALGIPHLQRRCSGFEDEGKGFSLG